MNVDTVACLGDTVPVSIGFQQSNNIVLQNGIATLGNYNREFLPDGVVCNGMCSYESTVTFNDFPPAATLTSVEDLMYVRLKIEHSYIGDIYIGIKCPSGRRASIMNWKGTGTSPCTDSVPTTHRNWNTDFTNTSGGTFLGLAYDQTGTPACDSTVEQNQPGVGWNYCWSNNTTQGYSYAPLDGRIYRNINATPISSTNHTIDSSDVLNGTNFYHPDEPFSRLIGCPMNGSWTIEVIDAYSQDNGYIFEWEMGLNPEMLPSLNLVDGQEVIGSQVIDYTDSTFGVTAPADADADTALTYQVHIFLSQGETLDTTFTVHYYTHQVTETHDTLCQGDTAWWRGTAITADTLILIDTTTIHGCDSIIHKSYTFNPTYEVDDTLSYCPLAEFLYEGVDYGGPARFDSPHLTVDGCDSLVHVVLNYTDSAFRLQMLVSDDGTTWSADTALHGCRPFEVWLRDTTPLEASRQWLLGDSDTLYIDSALTHIYDTVGVFSLRLSAVSVNGCTDTAYMSDAVHVYPTPTAAFDWDNHIMVIHDAASTLINLSQPDTIGFMWEITRCDGSTDTSTEAQPYYQWASSDNIVDEGDYTVKLTAIWTHIISNKDTLYCIDTATNDIHIINDFLKFPNLVTPNGDGKNDTWRIINLLECGIYTINELWIYNNWGDQVYHVQNISREEDFWDPAKGSLPEGTYYYRFAAKSKYGIVKRNGIIELLHGE